MKTTARSLRFAIVGVAGTVVQLSTLTLLHHRLAGHTTLVSALALEITLLHNLLWHRKYTWSDRNVPFWRLAVRFHVGNGGVSLLGTLILVRLLAERAKWPLLLANGVAIGVCSAVNFVMAQYWIFRGRDPLRQRAQDCQANQHDKVGLAVWSSLEADPPTC